MAKWKVQGPEPDEQKRKYLSQSDVPSMSLTKALKVAQVIADSYGKNATKPLRVAQALNTQPTSSNFRMVCGASIAYGLTEGGYNSEVITITALGRRIVAPIKDGDDLLAKREALLRPRVVRDFLTRYNESKLPSEQIARNVLEELGVPVDRTDQVFALIVEGARELGYLRDVKGSVYVDLDADNAETINQTHVLEPEVEPVAGDLLPKELSAPQDPAVRVDTLVSIGSGTRANSRVFITHGKNMEIVGQLKDLLTFGNFTPVIALEQDTVAKPVPDKVLDEMRSCAAAIIHVGSEIRVMDSEGRERRMLNENVLIEIGAAMALYGRKFILLVEKDVTLPSNLQGLYEVRYSGEKLDYEATMKLLRAFNDFR